MDTHTIFKLVRIFTPTFAFIFVVAN